MRCGGNCARWAREVSAGSDGRLLAGRGEWTQGREERERGRERETHLLDRNLGMLGEVVLEVGKAALLDERREDARVTLEEDCRGTTDGQ